MKWKERAGVICFSIVFLCTLHFYKKYVTNRTHSEENVEVEQFRRSTLNNISNKNHEEQEKQKMHPWDIWEEMVTVRAITSKSESDIKSILHEMNTARIVKVDVGHKGTQLKAQVTLAGPQYQEVVFKPKRYPRDIVLSKSPYEGFDRHNGEIAAFHLDRLLGFYRAPPVVGRKVNLERDIMPVTETELLKTFHMNENNNCFYGRCYYCKKEHSACAKGEIMEASLTIWLPSKWNLYKMRHPWQRTYSKRKAKWEIQSNYCKDVKMKPPYHKGPRLLDLMDTAIFDFLIGNADRHHYEFIHGDDQESMVIHLDNGKSFGNPYHDETSILTPIKQCCLLRHNTFLSIGSFSSDLDENLSLSFKLENLLKEDPIYPILTEDHLNAIDRRLNIIFETLKECFEKEGKENVLISD